MGAGVRHHVFCEASKLPRAREVLKELDVPLNCSVLLLLVQCDCLNQHPSCKVHVQLPRNVDNLIVLTEPLFEQDADAGREQEVTREELLKLGPRDAAASHGPLFGTECCHCVLRNVILDMRGDRDVRMEDIVELRCDIRRFVHRQ